jgi:hypothetical protein
MRVVALILLRRRCLRDINSNTREDKTDLLTIPVLSEPYYNRS